MSTSGQKRRASQEPNREFRQLVLLLDLTAVISQAKEPGEIYQAVAQGLVDSLSADRAAVLIFDRDDVLRFKESVALSEEYRAGIEGHTLWRRGAVDAQPIVVSDVLQDASLSAYRQAFVKEGIRAIAFIPLIVDGGLIGKLVLYHNAPHEFPWEEIRFAQAIATPVALAWARQHLEQALRDSERRLSFAQSAAHVGMWDCDLRTNVTLISPEYARLHGLALDRPSLTHEEWLGLVHADDRERLKARLEESIEKTHLWEREFRVVWQDGSVHWLLGKGQVYLDESGRPVRIAGVTLDVTERKRSEEKFSRLMEAAPYAMVVMNQDGEIVLLNSQAERLFGYRREEILGQKTEFLLPERFRGRHLGHRKDYFAQPTVRPMGSGRELYGLHKDRTEFPVEISLSPLDTDEGFLVSAAIRDITERKRMDEALRASEEQFRRVFEEGPLGLALVGKDYRFTRVNSALCEMVGYPEAELTQKTFTEITHPDDVHADVELAKQLFKREIPFYRKQKRYQKKNGEFIWINLTASIIRGPDGQPLHGLAMIEDITEIKRSQEEALFHQKLESLGTLAGGIAHDFNNLLGAVQAQTELALSELDAGSSCKDELNSISEVAMRGSEIVRQLMIYAGKESGTVGPVDLSQTVEEILALLKVSVTKHAVIEAHLDHNLPSISADAAQLRQIVMNLITNASDAIGDQDGVIRVITRCVNLQRESGASSSRILPDSEFVELEVSDTGRGMSPQTQAKVFDPFFTTKSAGRGLGLAVVHGIVRSLGGAIHLASEPDKGTTFQVLLPPAKITVAARGQAISSSEQTAIPSHHGIVLVVEDEDQLRQAIVKMLRKTGFEVFEAANGDAAVKLLRRDGGKIDVVLMDMTMPGAPIHEIIAEAVNAKPDIKVILTSAYSQEMIANSVSAPRIHSFIRKPFQFADLVKTLRSSLSS